MKKTFVVSVHKESWGRLEVEAEDEQEALSIADAILDASEEPRSTWGAETAEAEDAREK